MQASFSNFMILLALLVFMGVSLTYGARFYRNPDREERAYQFVAFLFGIVLTCYNIVFIADYLISVVEWKNATLRQRPPRQEYVRRRRF